MEDKLVIEDRVVATFEVDDEVGHLVREFELNFTARTEAELRTLSVMLGGIDRFRLSSSAKILTSPTSFETEAGRGVDVWIWLDDELLPQEVVTPPASVVEQVRAAAKAHREGAGVHA